MNTQEVLAVVAGEKITNADLDAFLQTVPKEQRLYASDPQFRGQYLEQLIAFRSFAKYGEDMKLDETEEFKKIMENMKREVLAQLAINTSLKDVTASDQEAVQYYEANKKRFEKGATVHAKHILKKNVRIFITQSKMEILHLRMLRKRLPHVLQKLRAEIWVSLEEVRWLKNLKMQPSLLKSELLLDRSKPSLDII